MPSADAPLTGSCACGAVSFQVTAPFVTAGYCHCKGCQRRSGTLWSLNAMVPVEGFEIVAGHDAVRTWEPPDGIPKAFCGECGGHLYSDGGDAFGVRLAAVDGDPGTVPSGTSGSSRRPTGRPYRTTASRASSVCATRRPGGDGPVRAPCTASATCTPAPSRSSA